MARRKTHPGSIRERSWGWDIRLMVDGARHYYKVKGGSREDAERLAREKHRELTAQAQREADGLPGAVNVSELLELFRDEYLPELAPGTQASYEDSLKPIRVYFREELGDPPLHRIHGRHVKGYLSWRRLRNADGTLRKKALSNRTLQKDRAVLHRLFSIAEKMELRDGNPVARVEPPKAQERDPVILTPDQYQALLTECSSEPMLALYALLLGETGLRCLSEALWLRWEDVDLQEGFLWIDSGRHGRRTKSGKGRWVPMTARLREAMRKHFASFRFASYDGKPSPWIFHHTQDALRRHGGNRRKAGSRIRKKLREELGKVAERAKLPEGFVAHDLRHRRVTVWLADGANPVHVKEALGHADLKTTMRYTHLAREHLRSLVKEPEKSEREELREIVR